MRFLIDANLPASLAQAFTEAGHDCVHIETLLPRYAPDTDIAPIANRSGAVLVTRDQDFVDFSRVRILIRPMILLRFGNLRRAALITSIRDRLPSIIAAISAGEKIVVLR